MGASFFLSDDQRLFRDSLGKLIAERWSDAARRKSAEGDPGYDKGLWRALAEQGALGAFLPESAGGTGGGGPALMVAMEAFGRSLLTSPAIHALAMAPALLKGKHLDGVAEGERNVAVGLTEPGSRYDLNHVETRAEKMGKGFALTGRKIAVPFASGASQLIVPARVTGDARDPDGIALFLIDPGSKGVSLQSSRTADSQRTADVTLSGAEAEQIEGGHAELVRAVDLAILAQGAEAVGHMRTLLDMTVAYTKTREQFGSKLSTFQALQHRMVDMFAAVETAASAVQAALAPVTGPGSPISPRAAVLTKLAVDKSARLVGQEAVQLHGGMAMTDDLVVGHHFKRLTMMALTFADQGKLMERYRDLEEGEQA